MLAHRNTFSLLHSTIHDFLFGACPSSMSAQIPPIFGQGVGYGIVLGLGAAFAVGMSFISWGLTRYFAEKQTSEMFMTAKHSVKTGLTASAVVSSWTIAATLLTSTTGAFLVCISHRSGKRHVYVYHGDRYLK